ncbi:MAG: DUF481 domain-containing protein [Acidobacteriota bacterium]
MGQSKASISLILASFIFLFPTAVWSEDSAGLGWSSGGRISFVHSEGNGDFTAAELELAFHRQWANSGFDFGVGAVLARNQTLTREATGTPDAFVVADNKEEETIAENWSLSLGYERNLSEPYISVTHAGWERDEPGGIRNRYSFGMGLGIEKNDEEGRCVKSVLSLTWTRQENLIAPAGSDTDFPGFRVAFSYRRPINPFAHYESDLKLYGNLQDIDDYRSDWTHAINVSITDWLAFEAAAQWTYSSRPPLEEIPLLGPDREVLGRVTAPLDEHGAQISVDLVFQN